MKRQFSDRVAIEREVLSLVNSHYKKASLHGLTEPAISRWSQSLDENPKDIVSLVQTISKRARLDVDASRDIFIEGELELKSTTQEYVQLLANKLGNKKYSD